MEKVLATLGKGVCVTFGSTVVSCVIACEIEKKTNRMIYAYFPHKFAHIKHASGITQDELDLAHMYYGGANSTTHVQQDTDSHRWNQDCVQSNWKTATNNNAEATTPGDEILFRYDHDHDVYELQNKDDGRSTYFDLDAIQTTINKNNELILQEANNAIVGLQTQDILACSMTA